MTLRRAQPASLQHYEDEQIDLLRIRLWDVRNCTAVLSDFYGAERVLAQWALDGRCNGVHFEVSFIDGCVVKGYHEFFNKGKRSCTFSAHLRRMLKLMANRPDLSPLTHGRNMSRYLVPT